MKMDFLKKIQEFYRKDETECLEILLKEAAYSPEIVAGIQRRAAKLVTNIRGRRLKQGGLDAFLYTYDLSSEEGIALMCLAEALLRIPDSATVDKLIKDKIASQDWEQHLGKSPSFFVNAATWSLMLTGNILNTSELNSNFLNATLKKLIQRTGEPVIRQAVRQMMKILGKQFVMGQTIEEALERAKENEAKGYRYSYDMLGEAAKTARDAEFYFQAYQQAIAAIHHSVKNGDPILSPGISVKLSALHPRYEWVNRDRMFQELSPRLVELAVHAMRANIGFTIDAEEADRLELSLLLFEKLALDPRLGQWQGLGLAVQAYQKRAPYVIDWVVDLAKRSQKRIMVRLVKGAYWDSEIKWSQEKGLKNYPVFTRKAATDVSFEACVKKLFQAKEFIYPQFASHNAYSVSYVLEVAKENQAKPREFEFQCLHGMGDSLYDSIVGPENLNIACRIYAPVGGHQHLLGYLVRRLLENGANTSFVNRILDENLPVEQLIQDPVAKIAALSHKAHPKIPLPSHLYPDRPNSSGLDLTDTLQIDPVLKDIAKKIPSLFKHSLPTLEAEDLEAILSRAHKANHSWNFSYLYFRAECLENMANLLEQERPSLLALLIREGGKTVQDANSELREAIDYCWYYREQLLKDCRPLGLAGPTGELNQLQLHPRGTFACISPWNFPLAIFLGQIVGALAAGNTVIAKPASQTPYIAAFTVKLLHQAGFPVDVVQLAIGRGEVIGSRLIQDHRVQGVMFTGSTETAKGMNKLLAERPGPILPFIAETGGQNAMIVDSSALPEQVVTDVLTSAFNSAGQRCSALRLLCIQEDIAEILIPMLQGAMAEIKIGDPLDLSTDVGPMIDKKAKEGLEPHLEKMAKVANALFTCRLPAELPKLPRGEFFAPRAFQIDRISVLTQEVFGPILHVITYPENKLLNILQDIRNTGYGLTLGIHSRIEETIQKIIQHSHVGNIYVNRNMIGAVVGVQPFGGEGLSGTGPKAGGPHMLSRLSLERTVSVNVAASGGNVSLMALEE